jgi:hypothetical protein
MEFKSLSGNFGENWPPIGKEVILRHKEFDLYPEEQMTKLCSCKGCEFEGDIDYYFVVSTNMGPFVIDFNNFSDFEWREIKK